MITVGSFNVAAGLIPDCEAINRLLEKYEVDVVGFQEVDQFTVRNSFDMLAKLGGERLSDQCYGKAFEFPDGGEYGIGCASRFPHTTVKIHKYLKTGEEDRIYQKISYDVDGKEVVFFNTHLAFETPEIRKFQIKELMEEVKHEKDKPVIVVGDFNVDTDLAEWENFKGLTLINGKDNSWQNTYLYHDATMKNFVIDNIMINNHVELVEFGMPTTPLSDHAPLIAKLKIK